jgi:hypothetical protein
VSFIAKVNTTTGVWSAPGDSGSRVLSQVFALAVNGSDLYVGGDFSEMDMGGTTIRVNNVAKVNTLTGVWSVLGTGAAVE